MFRVGDASIIKTLLHLKLLNMTLSLSARSSSVQETVLVTGSDCLLQHAGGGQVCGPVCQVRGAEGGQQVQVSPGVAGRGRTVLVLLTSANYVVLSSVN